MKTKIFAIVLGCMVCLLACKKDTPDEKIKIVTDTVIVRDTVVVTDTVVIHDTVCIETTKYIWKRVGDIPFEFNYFYRFPSFVAQDNIYFLHNTTVYKYDTGNNTWSNINPFPVARDSYAAFSVNNYGFVASGACDKYDCAKTPLLWRYIPDKDTFVPFDTLTDYFYSQPNYVATFGFTTFLIYSGSKNFIAYNYLVKEWNIVENSQFSGTPEISFVFDNQLYIGWITNFNDRQLWQYNPNNEQWIAKTSFRGSERIACYSFTVSNKGYLFGGWVSSYSPVTYLYDMWEYNPQTDKWKQLPDAPFAWIDHAITIDNATYIFRGTQTWKFTVEQSTKKIKQ